MSKQITKKVTITLDKKLADMEGSLVNFVALAIDSYLENNTNWIAEQLKINPDTERGELKLDSILSSVSISEGI